MADFLIKTIYFFLLSGMLIVSALFAFSFFKVGGMNVKIVMSGSMEPAIKTGSIVLMRPAVHPVGVGDVITFGKDTRKDIPTTHRVLEFRSQEGQYVYKTKGDANTDADTNEVSQNLVIGKVIFSIPYLGYILDMAKKPIGFALLIVLPALLIIGDEIHTIWTEIQKRRRDKHLLSGGGASSA